MAIKRNKANLSATADLIETVQPGVDSATVINTTSKIDEQVRPDCPVLGMLMNQVKLELESSHLYMAFSLIAERYGYVNTAQFFMHQSHEERVHAIQFINEMTIWGKVFDVPTDLSIKVPKITKIGDLLNAAMEHEVQISNSINCIYIASNDAGAGLMTTFLGHMLSEQREEEQLYRSILRWFKLSTTPAEFEGEILKIKAKCGHIIGNLPLE